MAQDGESGVIDSRSDKLDVTHYLRFSGAPSTGADTLGRPEGAKTRSRPLGPWRTAARSGLFLASWSLACALAAPSRADEPADPGDASAGPSAVPASAAPAVDPHAAQNPIASVISIPFQNNTSADVGPLRGTENVLLIQPVVPFSLNSDWSLVTRWVTPIISTPRLSPSRGPETGLGDIEPQFYFTPAHPGPIIWGIGPEAFLPTATDKTFGIDKWGGGITAVALTIQGHWLYGALVNNVWAGSAGAKDQKFNELTLQPFAFYNLPNGWYLVSSTVMTANWEATSRNQWTVPVGGGVGRVFKVRNQKVNARVELMNNVLRPAGVGTWTGQFQLQLLY